MGVHTRNKILVPYIVFNLKVRGNLRNAITRFKFAGFKLPSIDEGGRQKMRILYETT